MLSLIFALLVLNLSLVFCSLTDPKCFMRKKKNDNELDMEEHCFFSIYTEDGYVKNNDFTEGLNEK